MARPTLKFDDKDHRLVDALIRHGVPAAVVARELGIDERTLAKHFADTIATARATREGARLDALWARARGGSARALIRLERMTRAS